MLSLFPTSFEMSFRLAVEAQDAILGMFMALVGNLAAYLGTTLVP
jgi:hypothetical protein